MSLGRRALVSSVVSNLPAAFSQPSVRFDTIKRSDNDQNVILSVSTLDVSRIYLESVGLLRGRLSVSSNRCGEAAISAT